MKIIDTKDKNSLQNAAGVLKKGGILIFPTDTVYGIGCLLNKQAIRRLYKIKNRPRYQPTSILFTKKLYHKIRSSVKSGIEVPKNMQKGFFSGKVTIVFPMGLFQIHFPQEILKDNKVGIRLPQSKWLEDLIDKVGPIATASANKKGLPPPARFSDIDPDIIGQPDLAVKIDKKLPGIASRVYNLETKKYFR